METGKEKGKGTGAEARPSRGADEGRERKSGGKPAGVCPDAARRLVWGNPHRMLGIYAGDAMPSLEEWEARLDSGAPPDFPCDAGLPPLKRDDEGVFRARAFLSESPCNRLLSSVTWFHRDDSPVGDAFFRAFAAGNLQRAEALVRSAPNNTAGYFNRAVLSLIEGRYDAWLRDVAGLALSPQWAGYARMFCGEGRAVSPQEFADAFVPWIRRSLPEEALPDDVLINAGGPFAQAVDKSLFGSVGRREGDRGKVTLLGVEGSGKTVLTMALVEAFKRYERIGLRLRPDSRESYRFLMQQAGRLERGELPAQTANLKCLVWTLTRGRVPFRNLDVLDYPGEIYRLAFLDASDDPEPESFEERVAASREEITLFLKHLTWSEDVFVLFNLDDAVNQRDSPRNLDAVWVTNACMDYLHRLPRPPRITLLLTQIDRYCDLGRGAVDARRLYERHLDLIAQNFPDIPVLAVSAVHADSAVNGMNRLVKILAGAESEGGAGRPAWPVPESAVEAVRCKVRLLRRKKEDKRKTERRMKRAAPVLGLAIVLALVAFAMRILYAWRSVP